MKKILKIAVSSALALSVSALAGCGTQKTGVPDSALSCAAINQEIAGNNNNINELEKDKSNRQAKNVAYNALNLLSAPNSIHLGYWKDKETKQIEAYQDRNQVLVSLAQQRECPMHQAVQVKSAPAQKAPKK